MKKPIKRQISREEALETIKERIAELSRAIREEVNVKKQKMLQETLRSNERMYVLITKGLI